MAMLRLLRQLNFPRLASRNQSLPEKHVVTRRSSTSGNFDSRALCENQLLRKALSERHQQLEWAIEPNLPPQQCPHHVFFLPQKADPRFRVSGNAQIRLANMPLFHADLLFLNYDSCLPLLMAGE